MTIGFAATTTEQAGRLACGRYSKCGTDCEDPPGWREGPNMKLYLAYLRDPAGNKMCVLHR